MYSAQIEKFLKAKKISIGDRVKVGQYEGILMPRIELGDTSSLVIKLDNGYNIGVKFDKSMKKVKTEWRVEKPQAKTGVTKIVFDKKLPTISIIGTGGTIASKVDYKTGGTSASFLAEDIAKQVPDLKEIANIRAWQIMEMASEDMVPDTWVEIAKAVAEEINQGSKGIIVTHGTDTLHYTAAALSFLLKDLPVPVAVVGSQRSSDRGSSDTVQNVSCAANFVANSDVAEVCTVLHGSVNDDFCFAIRGTKSRKMHTSRRDAFKAVNDAPIAKIWWQDKRIEILNSYKKRNDKKVLVDGKIETKVALVKFFVGMDPDVLDFYKKYKGIVIEGTGLGHVATRSKLSLIPKIGKMIKAGIPVVMTSQTIYGRTHPSVYRNLRTLSELGVIFVEDMLPETAYIKLMHILPKARNVEDVKKLMQTNMVGEITERTEVVSSE
ncbi:Glu-tRNA(Gln) amidotransferase subunit GatD [archaeon]|nr:MAG: Glu-tRNA(Gln) amidotransferase subunit GatD [archaeon]